MPPRLDLEFVRAQFPAFSGPGLAGQAFFENAGGSYACRQVIERLDRYYRRSRVQPYGCFAASREAGEQMDHGHQRIAEYLNVPADSLHFGPSTSQNTYVLAQAFRRILRPGDEIIVTNQDHEANSGVWRRLAGEAVTVREWAVDPDTGMLDPAALQNLLSERTRVLAFSHCSNIVGHINPVAEICAQAHAAGSVTVVDGVSYAPHGFPDLGALGADIYLFSLYKTYGPHQGAMMVKPALAAALGNEGHFFNDDAVHKRLVPAGPDHAQVAASAGVAEYFDALHSHHFPGRDAQRRPSQVRALIRTAELERLPALLDWLAGDRRVRLLGPAGLDGRAPTLAFVPHRRSPASVAESLAEHGIQCGAGHFYAYRLLQAMGVDPATGAVRLSFVHYTRGEEIERLLQALDTLI